MLFECLITRKLLCSRSNDLNFSDLSRSHDEYGNDEDDFAEHRQRTIEDVIAMNNLVRIAPFQSTQDVLSEFLDEGIGMDGNFLFSFITLRSDFLSNHTTQNSLHDAMNFVANVNIDNTIIVDRRDYNEGEQDDAIFYEDIFHTLINLVPIL
jgi:hypothetical protein